MPIIRSALLLISLLLLAVAAPARAQALTTAGLQADVDVLEQAYLQLHPGLYRYNTRAQMAAHFRELRASLDHDQSLADAYLAFSIFAAKVKCGHTYANFFNQPESIAQSLFHASNRVPFQFRWLDGHMVITRNLSTDASLVPGTEVQSIDGIAASKILARLLSVARADGNNDAKRVVYMEVQGNDRYEAFDIFLPLFFPQIGAQQTLVVKSPTDAASRPVSVTALSHAERLATLNTPIADNAPAFTVRYRDDGVAVLDMPGWALYDSTWDWRGFLSETFESLHARNTPALIIDLRRNEGGLDVGDEILAYLTARDVRMPAYVRKVRYRSTPEALRPYLDTWDRSFNDWGDAATPTGDGFYRLLRKGEDPAGDVITPKAPRYQGRVYVLVGATNSSATYEFARAIRHTRLATLVGQTTGGNRRGINGGAFFFLRLPHSKIELDLPIVGQFPLTPQPDAGIKPDIFVRVTSTDIAAGRDAEMEAALADFAKRSH